MLNAYAYRVFCRVERQAAIVAGNFADSNTGLAGYTHHHLIAGLIYSESPAHQNHKLRLLRLQGAKTEIEAPAPRPPEGGDIVALASRMGSFKSSFIMLLSI